MKFSTSVNTLLELNSNSSVYADNLQTSALVEELNRVKVENQRLTDMLKVACDNYDSLLNHWKDASKNQAISKKRKVAGNNLYVGKKNTNGSNFDKSSSSRSSIEEDCCNTKKTQVDLDRVEAKISRISVRTEISDTTLVVEDGYKWKKYGQKLTRDNPCPRAYFKCSFAPSCLVKKKVQRSSQDQSVMIATYEGEHNHPILYHSKAAEQTPSPPHSLILGSVTHNSASLSSSGPMNINLMEPAELEDNTCIRSSRPIAANSPEFQQCLVEQMASTLTKDPGFKAALLAAVTGKFLHQ